MWLILLLACRGGPDTDTDPDAAAFPDGFLWGSATAGFQVDMGCPTWSEAECTDPASDWYQWVTDPELVADPSLYLSGDPLTDAPGMWETHEEDADRMVSDGFSAYRMSIEWSRLFPDAAAGDATTVDELAAHADPDAVARYHDMFAALRDRGIEPLVTINHYTLPLWAHDAKACHEDLTTCPARGWVDTAVIDDIALYAGFVGREYGGAVDRWATLNEPLATVLAGYLVPGEDRSAPPGIAGDGAAAKAVLFHQIEGHARMVDAVRAEDVADADGDGTAASIGLVMNMAVVAPRTEGDAEDELAVAHADHLYHRLFLDAVTDGAWDDDLDGTFETQRDDLAGRLDWVGVNYYATMTVAYTGVTLLDEIPVFDFFPEIDWVPHADGIGTVVGYVERYGVPIYVTENGTSSDDEAWRADMLVDTLTVLQEKTAEGADVRGYFYWSFVDNYEWNHGMSTYFFGLYALDPATKARTARPVLEAYREIVADNAIP